MTPPQLQPITPAALATVLQLHVLWCNNLRGGSCAMLYSVALPHADLPGVNLRGATLSRVQLTAANLRHAELSAASCRHVEFQGADLRGACFRGADLHGAVLCGARLDDADLAGAALDAADLRGTDLSRVQHLLVAQLLDATAPALVDEVTLMSLTAEQRLEYSLLVMERAST